MLSQRREPNSDSAENKGELNEENCTEHDPSAGKETPEALQDRREEDAGDRCEAWDHVVGDAGEAHLARLGDEVVDCLVGAEVEDGEG